MQTETRDSLASTLAQMQPVAPDAERFHALVRDAVLAPSSHNSQPWIFHVPLNCAFLELYADRTRALPVVDPDDRELTISCGAALFGMRLAARHAGFVDDVELLPDADDPDLLARMRLGARGTPSADAETLQAAVPRRHTSRKPFDARPVPEGLLRELQQAAAAQGAMLHVLREPAERERAADLVAEADRRQFADRAFRRELAAWMHPNRSLSRDGMPGSTLGLGVVTSAAAPLMVRTFDVGGGRAAKDRELATGSPVLALLWTVQDTTRDWLNAGQALYHVLLRACAAGVSASFLDQPIEVPELRTTLQDTLGIAGHAQLLLRLGYGPPAEPTPRRAVEDVIR